jgi:putative peptidoglycan lipid II flippase
MVLGQPIVKLLFERAAFDGEATAMTAQALFWFGPGMGAMAATQVLTKAYYAAGDTKTPLFFGLTSIIVNIAASILLTPPMAQGGLALANSLASLYYAAGMYILWQRRLAAGSDHSLLRSLAKVLAASVVTAAAAGAVYPVAAATLAARGSLGLLLAVGAAIAAGVLSFLVVIFLLKENELFLFISQLRRRKSEDV